MQRKKVSIQLVSPASGEVEMFIDWTAACQRRFHSISFPSEWGVDPHQHLNRSKLNVSIQLVSPASGEASIIHHIQGKMSRGHLRGCPKLPLKTPSTPQKKSLKPLPSNAARLPTKLRHLSHFPLSLANCQSSIANQALPISPSAQKTEALQNRCGDCFVPRNDR